MTVPLPRETQSGFQQGSDGHCLIEALTARQIQYRYLEEGEITNPRHSRPIIGFWIAGVPYYFDGWLRRGDTTVIPGPHIHGEAVDNFVNDKGLIKAFLHRNGFSVPEGKVFDYQSAEEAEQFFSVFNASLADGVCLKPARGGSSKQVYVGIRDLTSFRAAFADIGKRRRHVLIEELVQGQMHRILCVGRRAIAALSWQTMNVKGDGRHTIAELVELKNAKRRQNPAYADFPLNLGAEELAFLAEAGLSPDDIPPAGERVFLRRRPNEDEATDATELLHPSYGELIERAIGLLPVLPICGVDLMVRDNSAPASPDNYFILELNAPARFVDHRYPWRGEPRDVAGAIVDYLLLGAQSGTAARDTSNLPG